MLERDVGKNIALQWQANKPDVRSITKGLLGLSVSQGANKPPFTP